MIVWDPFHTSPEEYLGYVGLVPLFLAMIAVVTGWRGSATVRTLLFVGFVTLWLALGPYVPGFRLEILLPGFSFFRAPSRWTLATSLVLSLLAGIGFDRLATMKRAGAALVGFAVAGLGCVAVVVLAIEIALYSTDRPEWPAVSSVYARALDQLPWREPSVFERTVQEARRPFADLRVFQTWARQGVELRTAPRPVFAEQRGTIYRQELTGSLLLLVTLIAIAPLTGRRLFAPTLLILTFLDLWTLGRHRREDLGRIASLASQSPIFAELASSPRGTRTVDGLGNMPMVAGASPVSAYRTLDLPALKSLTILASRVPDTPVNVEPVAHALRLTGTDLRIFGPGEDPGKLVTGTTRSIRDRALAGWLLGKDFVAQQGVRGETFILWEVPGEHARGWLVPLTDASSAAILSHGTHPPAEVFEATAGAVAVTVLSADPEHRTITVHADRPSLLVLSQLADPEWQAFLVRSEETVPCEPLPAFRGPDGGAWQAIRIPEAGDWSVRMVYRGRDVYQGLAISAVAWMIFSVIWFRFGRERPGQTV